MGRDAKIFPECSCWWQDILGGNMIFVVLGTQKFQLDRLLKSIDCAIEDGRITDEVIAQSGNSVYKPKHFKCVSFMDKAEFDETIEKAELMITHSGVGSIITALGKGKPVIVYPRLAKYKEHVDNHQLDIANAFGKKNYVLCCFEEDDLVKKIEECKSHKFDVYVSQRDKMVETVSSYLKTL